MPALTYPHLDARPDGTLVIAGTGIKVIMLATMHLAHGWTAEELQRQYPSLTLGQIHSALAYYYGHQTEVNQAIEQRLAVEQDLVAETSNSPLRLRLQALKNGAARQ